MRPAARHLLWALLAVPGIGAAATATAPAAAEGDDAAAAARLAYLTQELAAAKSKQFYLVFDEATPAIDLKIEGVRVHRFVLDRAEFGQSRLAGSGPRQWPAASFSLVSEVPEPDRPRIQVEKTDEADKARDAEIRKALARGEKPAGELSQTAGEKVARLYRTDDVDAPLTFRLQFEPDLVLVVRGEPRATDLGSRMRRVKYALQDGWQGFRLWLGDEPIATRVVVHLPPEDARRLFKVLVPEIRLLVQE
jgi:hypothetical protein